MNELEIWKEVNSCETSEELTAVVRKIADANDGIIKGRNRDFNANNMATYVGMVIKEGSYPTLLTREYGIRQQALYIRAAEQAEKTAQ